MTTPLWCLLFLAMWTWALLVGGIATFRVGKVLFAKARPNSFPADTPHGPGWYRRLMRAHMNSVENLPVFAVLIGIAHVVGLQDGTVATLSLAIVAGRISQTIAHISSGRSLVVNVRFAFFCVQILAGLGIAGLIVQQAMGA